MIVSCTKCQSKYQLNPKLVKQAGAPVRCSQCKHVFIVYPVPRDLAEQEQAAVSAVSPEPKNSAAQKQAVVSAVSASSEVKDKEKFSEKDQSLTKPKKYTPFKRKLIYFAAILIGFVALIVIPIEAYRPYSALYQKIDNAKILLSGIEAVFDPVDVLRMNQFGLDTIAYLEEHPEALTMYHGLAFNMLLLEGKILAEAEVTAQEELMQYFQEEQVVYRHEDLLAAGAYWEGRFEADAGIQEILRRFKQGLINSRINARKAGFKPRYIMIMLDSGKREGFFKDHVAFLLESTDWWTYPTYCGEPYKYQPSSGTWRDLALEGRNDFAHSAIADPVNFYLPRIIRDSYGNWFSVWMTRQSGDYFNNYSIDFDASQVIRLVVMIAIIVFIIFIIITVITVIITGFLSKTVTRPITELTYGSLEVAKGNYDYRVPEFNDDEFGELIRQFNMMTKGQKERLNLMITLEKFLSKDLAERAAERGILLGGQKANCTVMFTDFAGFSTITQKMAASEAVNILNAYFDGLVPIIKKYGGFPDKYIGDAIVALFGAPVELEDHAVRAVSCAIEMQWKMREINDIRRREGKTVFEMRIGLNSGDVLVGAIGCDMKLEYTSIGETTNLANRMEAICEIGHIMIAEGTYSKICTTFFKGVDIEMTPQLIQVKGYPQPVRCYRIFVDNLKIEKDLEADGPIRSYYIYTLEKHNLRQAPDEIKSIKFTDSAQYML